MVKRITSDDAKEMTGWDAYQKITVTFAMEMQESFEVETLEGTMKGGPGDFLCMNKTGEVWPVKREIFLATYRLAAPTSVVIGRMVKAHGS
jgi:hypothetical protein